MYKAIVIGLLGLSGFPMWYSLVKNWRLAFEWRRIEEKLQIAGVVKKSMATRMIRQCVLFTVACLLVSALQIYAAVLFLNS